ncbi:MAG: DUF5947 family protein, partial [Methylocystis sp.]|nr:DUF5947 family protein [Methylocystis sp.]
RHWRGLSGGSEVWEAVRDYFTNLQDGVESKDRVHG